MMDCRFVPLVDWPGEKTKGTARLVSRFKTSYSKTLDLLEAELFHLGGKDILVQAFFTREQLRNDGWPKSTARPNEPGIIVTFTTKKGETISMPCDRFTEWEANLRAIALSLTALRTVDRYGVTRNGEQYRGWQQLPHAPTPERPMSVREAVEVVGAESGVLADFILQYAAHYTHAMPLAIKASHPDKGGSAYRFRRVMEARTILNQIHGANA